MAAVSVAVLGQPDNGRTGLADLVRSGWPGARGRSGEATAATGRRAYTLTDPLGREEACDGLLAATPDVAVVAVPTSSGLWPGTREQVRLARGVGVGSFVLFVDRCAPDVEPAWADLVEADAREALAAEGLPADDLPSADSLDGLFAALDLADVPPGLSSRPTRLTVLESTNSFAHQPWGGGRDWQLSVRIERGLCVRGERLELVDSDRPGTVTVLEHTESGEVRPGQHRTVFVSVDPGTTPEPGDGLAVPGTLRAVSRFGVMLMLRPHGQPGPLRAGRPYILLRGGVGPEVVLSDLRRGDGTRAEECWPGEWAMATAVAIRPWPLEPHDRFALYEVGHPTHARGVVLDVSPEEA